MLSGEACILQLLQANRSRLGNHPHCSVTQTNTMKLSSGIKFKVSHWTFQFYSYLKGHLSEIFKYITYLLIKLITILIASLTDLDGFRKVIQREVCNKALETFETLFYPQLYIAFQIRLSYRHSLQRQGTVHVIPEG